MERLNAEWHALISDFIFTHAVKRRDHAAFASQYLVGECDEQSVWDRSIG